MKGSVADNKELESSPHFRQPTFPFLLNNQDVGQIRRSDPCQTGSGEYPVDTEKIPSPQFSPSRGSRL